MNIQILKTTHPMHELVPIMDLFFMESGKIIPLDEAVVDNFPRNDLRAYCRHRGIYTVVTNELLRHIQQELVTHTQVPFNAAQTIEIGAGNGTLSLGLGIKATDNKMQTWPVVRMYYETFKQPVINYPDFVEEIDAIDAIKKYKPHTVIGSWISSKYREDAGDGNMFGPDETEIMEHCERYILIGNKDVHGGNLLFDTEKYNHQFLDASSVRSRAKDPSKDFIVVFTKRND